VDPVLDDLALWYLVEHEPQAVTGVDGGRALGRARVDGPAEHVGPELREPGNVGAVDADGEQAGGHDVLLVW
jgi:hypothetical protein